MLLTLMKSKLHNARVTDGNVEYRGSMGISRELMEATGILPFEKILCANSENGRRWETYAIPVDDLPGQIVLNGAAARLGSVGDRVIIMCFAQMTANEAEGFEPKVAILNEHNEIVEMLDKDAAAETSRNMPPVV